MNRVRGHAVPVGGVGTACVVKAPPVDVRAVATGSAGMLVGTYAGGRIGPLYPVVLCRQHTGELVAKVA